MREKTAMINHQSLVIVHIEISGEGGFSQQRDATVLLPCHPSLCLNALASLSVPQTTHPSASPITSHHTKSSGFRYNERNDAPHHCSTFLFKLSQASWAGESACPEAQPRLAWKCARYGTVQKRWKDKPSLHVQ
ncbi:hypothetical protein ONS95_004182 [Cadophora gregata]|uniref:uncharacterized protein n=1 Tax=Cadophora gregata TaxID=51156 RepID=UPI0026DC6A04|nr:uncharacterized protein ONS95_004182 [Cadophora gregata]KAK0105654.1 hypothetical protein ONS95_004182 [Cadophora gregata]